MNCLAEVVELMRGFRLLVDVLTGKGRSDSLSSARISSPVSDIETVGDFVAAGVYLDVNVFTHDVDDVFHRLTA